MDQLKKQLAGVLQYGFWIGCTVVLVGSLAVWFLSTSELNKQNKAQEQKITSDVQKVSTMRGEMADQPNDDSHEKMNIMIDARKDEVLKAWQRIYNAQTKILTWPENLIPAYVDEFRYVRDPETGKLDKSKLKLPFELYVNHGEGEYQADARVLNGYRYYIDKELPSIVEIAKVEWTADFNASAGGMGGEMGGGGGMEDMMAESYGPTKKVGITGVNEGPVVAWSTSSQEALLADLFPWRGRKPSTLQVYYTQENLWILKQMLQIINEINGNARQPFEAKIHEIVQLSIGKSVRFGAGSIADPGVDAMGGGGMYDMMEMGGMEEMGMADDMGAAAAEALAADPGDGRYVNTEDTHITGSELRGALTSNSPTDAPIAVAKRVPVKIVVKMDQRFIPKLLAACGSAALMVEVKQTRILPKDHSGSASAEGGEMGGGMEAEGEGGEMGGGMMGGMMGGGATKKKDDFPLDMLVEVYGLIYLYNPPNEEALGIEKVVEEVVIDKADAAPVVEAALPAPAAAPAADPAATPADTAAPADPGTDPAAPANPAAAPIAGPAAIGSPAPLATP